MWRFAFSRAKHHFSSMQSLLFSSAVVWVCACVCACECVCVCVHMCARAQSIDLQKKSCRLISAFAFAAWSAASAAFHAVLQCVMVCCSVLQCVAVCCSVSFIVCCSAAIWCASCSTLLFTCVAVYCSLLQCMVMCHSIVVLHWKCVAVLQPNLLHLLIFTLRCSAS